MLTPLCNTASAQTVENLEVARAATVKRIATSAPRVVVGSRHRSRVSWENGTTATPLVPGRRLQRRRGPYPLAVGTNRGTPGKEAIGSKATIPMIVRRTSTSTGVNGLGKRDILVTNEVDSWSRS